MMGYQGHIYVFTSDGKAYCIDETTLTCRKSVAAGPFKVGAFKSSHAHKGDIYFSTRSEYLSEPGELVVYNLDTKKWVGVQPKTEVQRLRTSTNSYLVGSNGTFVPLFPNRFEVSEHALTAYADCCKEAFRFHKDQLKVNVTPEFKQFVEAIEGTGRLCYEHIFDYIDPTLALLIIAHMENKDNYLLSGEWKLRRDRSYFLLLVRLWQKKTDSAQSLLMGLMLIKDPVALKLFDHSRSYGVKDLGAKLFTKTQVDKLISGIGDLLL